MRLLLALVVFAFVGPVAAQNPMVKTGPGGTSAIEVTCDDAFRTVDVATRRDLERRFGSSIVLRCVASAASGSGRVAFTDFSYRHRYASDERMHRLRMTDFHGQMGEVYGSLTREFYIGLPDRQRPWVIVVYFGDDSTQIVVSSSR